MSLALLTATAVLFAQMPAQSGSTFQVIKKRSGEPTKDAKKKRSAPNSPASEAPPTPTTAPPPPVMPSAPPPVAPESEPTTAVPPSEATPLPSLPEAPPPPLNPRQIPMEGPRDEGRPRVLPWIVLVGSAALAVGGVITAIQTSEAIRESGDIEIVFDGPVDEGSTVKLPDELEENQQKVVVGTIASTVLLSAAAAGLVTGLTLLFDDD